MEFWLAFALIIGICISIDLFVVQRKPHAVGFREASAWAVVWIALAMLFNIGIYIWYDEKRALEFISAYLIELSLSVDNVFVFIAIFRYFRTPAEFQRRLLFWGVLGALAMRALFIILGLALLQYFHWMMFIFGVVLILTAVRLVLKPSKEVEIERKWIMRIARRLLPTTPLYHEGAFWVRVNGRFVVTPLFITLLMIETTDLLFALDSVPAVLAISNDPFIVYTSNAFAILGLRTFFFLISKMMEFLVFLHYGLSVILVFVGVKILFSPIYKIPTSISLGFISMVLFISVLVSLRKSSKMK